MKDNREIAPQVALNDLKSQSVRGGAFTFLKSGAGFFLNTVQTVVLARLLSPADFGLIGMVVVFTAFAEMFMDFGLSAATVQRARLTQAQATGMFWVNVLVGCLITILLCALAGVIAWFYGKPDLQAVTIALSVSFIFSGLGAQHSALLRRQMMFGPLIAAGLAGNIVVVAVSISLALNGFSYWSLVAGTLAGKVITTAMLWRSSGWIPDSPMGSGSIGELIRFGANITGFNLVNYFSRNLDNVLIGRFYGADSLGLYSKAYSLLMLPINNIRNPLTAAAMPAMSRLQDDPVRYRSYYRKISFTLALASMPLVALLAVSADSVILVLLGAQWMGAVEIFQYLAIAAFIQPVASLRGLVLISSGQSRRFFWWGVINAVVMVIAFGIGIWWGPIGIAIAYCVANYAILYPSMAYVFNQVPVTVSDFHRSIALPALAAIIAACGAWGIHLWFLPEPGVMALMWQVGVGSLIYLAVLSAFPSGRKELAALIDAARSLVRKKSSA